MTPALGGLLTVAAGLWARAHPGAAALLLATAAALLLPRARKTAPAALSLVALSLLFWAGWRGGATPAPPSVPLGEERRFRGTVTADPRPTLDGLRCVVDLEAAAPARPEGAWEPASGRLTLKVAGPAAPPPALGDKVLFRAALDSHEGFRNPGGGWAENYRVRESLAARAYARWPGEVLFAAPGEGGPLLPRVRGTLARAVQEAAPGRAGGVVRAVALGDRSGIDEATASSFRRAGTAHLLAVSGLHLGLVGLFAVAVFRALFSRIPAMALRWPVDPPARLAAAAFPFAYAALAGFQTSVVRALAMTVLVLAATAASRRVSSGAVLAATALAVAVVDPARLSDPGLHLSLAALAGIFWIPEALLPAGDVRPAFGRKAGGVAHFPRKIGRAAARACLVSAGAAAATLPVAAYHFGAAGWAGILVNPVAVPVGGVLLLALSLAGVLLFPLSPQGAELCWRGCARIVELLIGFQDAVVSLVGGSANAWAPGLPEVAGAYLLLGAFLLLRSAAPGRRRRAAALTLAGCMGLAGPAGARWAGENLFPRAEAWIFDVGQGVSVGMRLPGTGWVLVDGGGFAGTSFDVGEAVVEPALRTLGCRRLDLVISSHPHPDHVGGLPSLAGNMRAAEIWLPASFRRDSRYTPLLESARSAGSRVRWVDAGGARIDAGGTTLTVFPARGKEENDRSLMVRVEHGGRALLLPGDAEGQAQAAAVAAAVPLACDVLLAPHHGSADAVDGSFFAAAAPRTVVVSCGGRGEFPSEGLSAAARGIGAAVRSTRVEGCLKVRFEGEVGAVTASPR